MAKNNSGGAAQPKTGKQYTPLCRASGYDQTEKAIQNKTRSGHQHMSKHYQYEGVPSDDGANVHGYHPE